MSFPVTFQPAAEHGHSSFIRRKPAKLQHDLVLFITFVLIASNVHEQATFAVTQLTGVKVAALCRKKEEKKHISFTVYDHSNP